MKRVFIPQEPRRRDPASGEWKPLFDLTPALKFGVIEVLIPHGPVMLDTTNMINRLKEQLKDYTAEDYIMCIGDPSAIAAAVLVAGMKTGGSITLLKYDRTEQAYNVIKYQA